MEKESISIWKLQKLGTVSSQLWVIVMFLKTLILLGMRLLPKRGCESINAFKVQQDVWAVPVLPSNAGP